MRIVPATFVAISFAVGAFADTHSYAVCVSGRQVSSSGGTAFSPSMSIKKEYEIDVDATKCASKYYKGRNTGDKKWNKCPDCTFDGLQCTSVGWHMGGEEMDHYCRKYCGAQGSEGDKGRDD